MALNYFDSCIYILYKQMQFFTIIKNEKDNYRDYTGALYHSKMHRRMERSKKWVKKIKRLIQSDMKK